MRSVTTLFAFMAAGYVEGCTLGGQVKELPPVAIDSPGLNLDCHFMNVSLTHVTEGALRGLRALNFTVSRTEEHVRGGRLTYFLSAHRDEVTWIRLVIQEIGWDNIEVALEISPPDEALAKQIQSELARQLHPSPTLEAS